MSSCMSKMKMARSEARLYGGTLIARGGVCACCRCPDVHFSLLLANSPINIKQFVAGIKKVGGKDNRFKQNFP